MDKTTQNFTTSLLDSVVRLTIDEAFLIEVLSQEVLAQFVIDEDVQTEWHWQNPLSPVHGVGLQTLLSPWSVGESGSKCCFEKETENEVVVAHALLEHREFARFANAQVRPLNNHNSNEKRSVPSKFELLTAVVSPCLPIRILKVLNIIVVPILSQHEEPAWHPSICRVHIEVREESGSSLNYTNLQICESNKPGVDQVIGFGVSRGSFHNVRFCFLVCKRNSRDHISSKINAKNRHSSKWERDRRQNEE
mmetsp:Transcript_32665/g.45597  ORF Transcript_32665/g.45597 Transcript_32665/m.45597 type:complete len:250 (+) Transcript_32665:68-817(+)